MPTFNMPLELGGDLHKFAISHLEVCEIHTYIYIYYIYIYIIKIQSLMTGGVKHQSASGVCNRRPPPKHQWSCFRMASASFFLGTNKKWMQAKIAKIATKCRKCQQNKGHLSMPVPQNRKFPPKKTWLWKISTRSKFREFGTQNQQKSQAVSIPRWSSKRPTWVGRWSSNPSSLVAGFWGTSSCSMHQNQTICR